MLQSLFGYHKGVTRPSRYRGRFCFLLFFLVFRAQSTWPGLSGWFWRGLFFVESEGGRVVGVRVYSGEGLAHIGMRLARSRRWSLVSCCVKCSRRVEGRLLLGFLPLASTTGWCQFCLRRHSARQTSDIILQETIFVFEFVVVWFDLVDAFGQGL